MSAWGDMMRRGSGEQVRKEDTISYDNFSELYPDKTGPDYVIYDLKEYTKKLKEIKEQHENLEKQMRKISGILKSNFNV